MLPVWLTDTITPDLSRAVHYTLLWGLEGVVLRSLERGTRVPDVNENKLRKRLDEHDLPVAAIDPGLFEGAPSERAVWLNDLERLNESVAFCRRFRCPLVLGGALPGGPLDAAVEPLRLAAERVSRSGVRLAVRNEGDARSRTAELATVLDEVDHAGLVACWDPVSAVMAGESASDGASRLAGRVGLVMVRDGERSADGWRRQPLGEGSVGWESVLEKLRQGGFDGPMCLDLTGVPAKEGLREATALIQLIRRVGSK